MTATFAINTYTLTYTAGANGTITGTAPQTVDYGTSGTEVTAFPTPATTSSTWTDGVLTAARTDPNVTANITVTATFAINTYTLTYTAGANGTITGTTPQTVDYGTSGTAVTACPTPATTSSTWSDGVLTAARTDIERHGQHHGDGQLRDQHLHADLHGRRQRLDHGDVAADGRLRRERHGGHGGSRPRLPLRRPGLTAS